MMQKSKDDGRRLVGEVGAEVEIVKLRKPSKTKLTNKMGAFANPLTKDVDAWLKIGWYLV